VLGPWDVELFRWINGSWPNPLFDAVFRFFSLGVKLLAFKIALAAVLAIYLFAGKKTRSAAIQAMIAWPVANALCDVFKHTLSGVRPCVQLQGVRLVQDYAGKTVFLDSSGTMSAHAATMAAIAMVITMRLKWWGAPWIAIALITGVSRIYIGVHYPSQVLAGWAAGILCGWVVTKTWDAWLSRRTATLASRERSEDLPDR
jgi:undecaprenyl-diphosphatase